MGDIDPEIVRLENIIATLKAGLKVIARTEHFDQPVAKCMQFEANFTLQIVRDMEQREQRDKAFEAALRAKREADEVAIDFMDALGRERERDETEAEAEAKRKEWTGER